MEGIERLAGAGFRFRIRGHCDAEDEFIRSLVDNGR